MVARAAPSRGKSCRLARVLRESADRLSAGTGLRSGVLARWWHEARGCAQPGEVVPFGARAA